MSTRIYGIENVRKLNWCVVLEIMLATMFLYMLVSGFNGARLRLSRGSYIEPEVFVMISLIPLAQLIYTLSMHFWLSKQCVDIGEDELVVRSAVCISWSDLREVKLEARDVKSIAFKDLPHQLIFVYHNSDIHINAEVSVAVAQKPAKCIIKELKRCCPQCIFE